MTAAAFVTASDFIRGETVPLAAPLVPEITLHLARASRDIFRAAETYERPGERWPPYWAFAWPGGQGLARYILDNPHHVAGRRVADVGAGSGVGAIAAMMAGAKSAAAVDPDPLACAAVRMNAAQSLVAVDARCEDPLGSPPDADVILIGDLVYEPELETRVTGFLEAARSRGAKVLFGDRTTARRPRVDFQLLAEYRAPLMPALEDTHIEHARVWLMQPRARTAGAPTRAGT
jgi:predicted nicotinamide N-methyase